ncbi:MAG TPA: SDR family oxidoreductase [Amycolatopsis sp.]|nr:SDR family oxidoreductase [Amycolatopsis sp.]
MLHEQVALVTGGAAGIGKATVRRLAAEGAAVVVADIDEARAKEVVAEVQADGLAVSYVRMDMTDIGSIRGAVANTLAAHARIDVLVNNAGIAIRGHVLDQSAHAWGRIMAVNARGLFFCLQAVAAHMVERGSGRIVNVSSIGGKGSRGSSSPAYATAKAGVIGLTRMAAIELGPHGITVNAVCPGATAGTGVYEGLMQQDSVTMTALRGASAMNRINRAEDLANAIFFLASPLAATITGQSLNVDNGTIWD